MIDELSCILYVNYDKDDLAKIVAQLLGVTTNSRDIEHKLVLAYVARNKNIYSREKFRSGSDFLFYPQYIELEPTEIAEEEPFIELVNKLIFSLRKNCGDVEAACDYEDRLA